jgi:L-threonylcarbamoyladenylate synthase
MIRGIDGIAQAVRILGAGGLVAFATETVYGLGADATNARAVRKIFTAKGRPPTNPLIVHVADTAAARKYAAKWPRSAQRLARAFWPGPLTLVLPKGQKIVAEVTAGRSSVALRAPDHPLAQRLLRIFAGAIAAPSANRSTRVSPTTARHVAEQLGNRVDLILDGGPCRVGIESTVLDLTGKRPLLLRPGAVTWEQIEKLIGPVDVFEGSLSKRKAAASPGLQARHYSPKTAAFRFTLDDVTQLRSMLRRARKPKIALLSRAYPAELEQRGFASQVIFLQMPRIAKSYARRLYAALHEADALNVRAIWIEDPGSGRAWQAVHDRIRRATRPASAARAI